MSSFSFSLRAGLFHYKQLTNVSHSEFFSHRRLQKFLQFLAPAVVVVGEGNQNGDNKLRKLVSRVYLKLGEW